MSQPSHDDLRRKIVELARNRGAEKSICPSEAARALTDDWHPLMDDARAIACDLADEGVVDVMQHGEIVDGRTARGPIRIRTRH